MTLTNCLRASEMPRVRFSTADLSNLRSRVSQETRIHLDAVKHKCFYTLVLLTLQDMTVPKTRLHVQYSSAFK